MCVALWLAGAGTGGPHFPVLAYACPSVLLLGVPMLCALGAICAGSVRQPGRFDLARTRWRALYVAPGVCGAAMAGCGCFYYPWAGPRELAVLGAMQAIGLGAVLLYAGAMGAGGPWVRALTQPVLEGGSSGNGLDSGSGSDGDRGLGKAAALGLVYSNGPGGQGHC